MHRFFTGDIQNGIARITGEDVHHISRVLRLGTGDAISVCDGAGTDYDGVLMAVTNTEALANVINPRPSPYEPKLYVALYQGLPKGAKLDFVIQKCVELGASKIVPTLTKRCVAEAKGDFSKKLDRFQRIADEAAKQSRRGILPEVGAPETLGRIDFSGYDLVLVAYEDERCVGLKAALKGKSIARAAVIVGPEGGFEKSEIDALALIGAIPVSLGASILRTETAGLKAVANLIYEVCE